MNRSPQRIVLVLLSVALLALVSGLFLRGMINKDFRQYVEDERLALVRPVLVDIEASYDTGRGWDREQAAQDAVRALMLGLDVKVMNAQGELVMDTEQSIAKLSPERKARISAALGFSKDDKSTDHQSHPLMNQGKRIGVLEVTFLRTGTEEIITKRFGIITLVWSFILSGLALALAALLLRQPAVRISTPELPVELNSIPSLQSDMPGLEKNETASPPERQGLEPEKEIESPAAPEICTAAVIDEELPEAIPDEPMELDDEDMQPLAGDPDRVTRIVKGLDALAKAQAFRSALRKQPIELAQFLNNSIEKTRASVSNKDVTFNLECRDGLKLSADPDCLTGIMAHLLDNAVKAVKQAGTVTVRAALEKEHVVLAIEDTGTGISRKALPHIYERFYRGSGSGIGLGLAIVKELVDACEGTIEVRSTWGKGTLFTAVIPIS